MRDSERCVFEQGIWGWWFSSRLTNPWAVFKVDVNFSDCGYFGLLVLGVIIGGDFNMKVALDKKFFRLCKTIAF